MNRDFYKKSALIGITLLLSFLVFPHIARAAITEPVSLGTHAKILVPDSLLYFSYQNPGYLLLVEKSTQKAYLYQICNVDYPLKVYACSTGENRGPKCVKNDRKTPEGIYFITNSFKEQELSSVYGVRAFPIDYPNPLDRILGRKGYGIWIHGTNQPLKPRDTNGCIVFSNKDILELSRYISGRHTPIIITQKINFIERKGLQKEGSELKKFIMEWLETWKEGQIDRYMSFYRKDFDAQGKNWRQWRAHKRRLSRKYRTVDIKIDNLQILRENGIVLAKFDQTYSASGFFSNGVKRLYLQKKSPEWKITNEFFKKGKDLAHKAPAKVQREKGLLAITRLISNWQRAWQEKDLQSYMAMYSRDFFSLGLDRDGWKRHKSEINKRYSRISVEISNLHIRLLSFERATARFDQEYRSDKYHDKGKKTIQLVKRNGRWKIKTETWAPSSRKRAR